MAIRHVHMKMRLQSKRRLAGLNSVVALLLALGLAVALNLLGARFFYRTDLSHSPYYALTPASRELLNSLTMDVRVTVLLSSQHELYRDIRRLLREYADQTSRIQVEYIDPHRDLARSRELVLRYDVTESDVIVFANAQRKKIVAVKDLAEFDLMPVLAGRSKVLAAFRGEQCFSAAIQSLTQAQSPRVYFLSGHGEHSVADFDSANGYSMVARAIRQQNMEVQELNWGENVAVPRDCATLIIAGPIRRYNRFEIDALTSYLDNGGRAMLLLDVGQDAGLADLLATWGVRLSEDQVVGLTFTGRELLVASYGQHPITERLAKSKMATIFQAPRSVQPIAAGGPAAGQATDRPRLTILASCSEEGWAEMSPKQVPPRFDAGVDQPGPVSVAVAVEKGMPQGMDAEIKPGRMVVIGDSAFVANASLLAGYNADLFLHALDWLLERRESLSIQPRQPGYLRLVISSFRFQMIFAAVVMVVPAVVLLIGLWVWLRRRR